MHCRSSPDPWLQHWTKNLCLVDDQPRRPRTSIQFHCFQQSLISYTGCIFFLDTYFRLSQWKIPVFYPEQPSSPFPLTYTDTGMNHSIHLPFLNITRVLALFQYVQISSVLKDFWKLSTTDADAVQLTPLAIRLENQGLDHSYN